MKLQKIVAFILCIITLCILLASCGGKDKTDDTSDKAPAAINFEGAYAKHSPDEVMLVSSDGGLSAGWDLMYYFICLAIEEVFENTGTYPDLSDTSGTGYRDHIMTRAAESALACLAIEHAAAAVGAVITEDDLASIALNQELAEEQEGGAEAFRTYLAANHLSYEVYLYLVGVIDYLYENTILATYGEGAALFSDADTAAFLEDSEYLTVKQIFFSATEFDGVTPLDGAAIQEKHMKATHVLQMLTDYTGGDFDAYFDELMLENSEDTTALNMYPDGYLFMADETYPALYYAASALDVGTFSEVIETELGYHIVYRLPINYDIIPQGFAWDTRNTLRSQAARDKFGQYVEDLRIELGETASGDFYDLNLAELFK